MRAVVRPVVRPTLFLLSLVALALPACPVDAPTVDAGVVVVNNELKCRLSPNPEQCMRELAAKDALIALHALKALKDAGPVGMGTGDVVAVARETLTPSLFAFRFVRMRAPIDGGGEVITRIGLHERTRVVDGAPESKSAPSPAALATLVKLCASHDVRALVRAPGDTAPSMTTIELGCEPVHGVIACEPNAPCAATFDEVRNAIASAWSEEIAAPETGLEVVVTRWQKDTITRDDGAAGLAVLKVGGKPLLPAKGDQPFARAPNGKTVELCFPPVCSAMRPPVVAYVDVDVDVDANHAQIRCATCTPVPTAPLLGPGRAEPEPEASRPLSRAAIVTVLKAAQISVGKECARAKGPSLVKVSWRILPNGTVEPGNKAGESARERCVQSAVSRLRFPRSSESTSMTFPFKFP